MAGANVLAALFASGVGPESDQGPIKVELKFLRASLTRSCVVVR
jgi:hypothetical protein